MINCRHESLFARFKTTSTGEHRRGLQPRRGSRDLCHLGCHHQAIPQSSTGDGPSPAQSHCRSPCSERSSIPAGTVRTARSASRCQTRRAVPHVVQADWDQGQDGLYQSRENGSWVDTKQKILRATEQTEVARAGWRTQAADLPSRDLVFVETGSHTALTPLYASAPRGQRAVGKAPRTSGAITTLIASCSCLPIRLISRPLKRPSRK